MGRRCSSSPPPKGALYSASRRPHFLHGPGIGGAAGRSHEWQWLGGFEYKCHRRGMRGFWMEEFRVVGNSLHSSFVFLKLFQLLSSRVSEAVQILFCLCFLEGSLRSFSGYKNFRSLKITLQGTLTSPTSRHFRVRWPTRVPFGPKMSRSLEGWNWKDPKGYMRWMDHDIILEG